MALAIYTTDFDPTRLYATGDPGGEDDVRRVVRGGDDPVDLLVDFRRGLVLWHFRAHRRTKAMRTGYFYAVYRETDDDPGEETAPAFHFVDTGEADGGAGDGGSKASDGGSEAGEGEGGPEDDEDGEESGDGGGIWDSGDEEGQDEASGDDGGIWDSGDDDGERGPGDDEVAEASEAGNGDPAADVGEDDGADDLFRGFERELRELHDHEEWEIPHAEEPHWDAGFQLWRVAPDLPGLTPDERSRLVEHLETGGPVLEFGMSDFHGALRVLRAVQGTGVDCTVAVTRRGRAASLEGVDLVLRPVAEEDFVPVSPAAAEVLDEPARDVDGEGPPEADGEGIPEDDGEAKSARWPGPDPARVGVQVAVVALLALLAVATLSLFGVGPVRHATGFATVGGLVASALVGPPVATGLTADERTGFATAVRRGLGDHPGRSLLVIAYGTTFAFLYPTVFGAATDLLGPGGWPVGGFEDLFASAVWPLLAATVYVLAMLSVSFVLASTYYWRRRDSRLPPDLFVRLVAAHLLFGVALVVASDVASPIWGALGFA